MKFCVSLIFSIKQLPLTSSPNTPGETRFILTIANPLTSTSILNKRRVSPLLCKKVILFTERMNRTRSGNKEIEIARLQRQYTDLTDSMISDGILDDQFTQLQQLQDESNPEFVAEVLGLFFDDSDRLLGELSDELDKKTIDFKKVDAHVHQFKGSSSNIGAQQVKATCIDFRGFCEEEDKEGCVKSLTLVKEQYELVKGKLQKLLELEERIVELGGQVPILED